MKKDSSSSTVQRKRQTPVFTYFKNTIVSYDLSSVEKFYSRSRFGVIKSNSLYLSFEEALFLFQKEKILIANKSGTLLEEEVFVKRFSREDKDFSIKYAVYQNLRQKGYIVKTALKFGAVYRVYDKGVKPGNSHSKWIVFPVPESSRFTWSDFSAKSRVAHSTKKVLLLGIVDQELDVSYYEVNWKKV